MSTIRAKPTTYKATRFRSRLEARWAAFFDAVGREWVYEPEVPELGKMQYQPDFMIEGFRRDGITLVEVKPMIDSAETAKLIADPRWKQAADLTGGAFILLIGAPGEWVEGRLIGGGHFAVHYFPEVQARYSEWTECPQCGAVGIWEDGYARCCPRQLPEGPLLRAYEAVRDTSFGAA